MTPSTSETEPVGGFTDVSQLQKLNTSYIYQGCADYLDAWIRKQHRAAHHEMETAGQKTGD